MRTSREIEKASLWLEGQRASDTSILGTVRYALDVIKAQTIYRDKRAIIPRTTHTYAELPVSDDCYDEVHAHLARAGYQDQFNHYDCSEGGHPAIDMQGIALSRGGYRVNRRPDVWSFAVGIFVGAFAVVLVGGLAAFVGRVYLGLTCS